MTIIDQLETTLTPAILGDSLGENADLASISLLEQFYALLVARLATADIYSQLLHDQHLTTESNNSVFEELWPYLEQRQLIIDELSVTYHVDEVTTSQLITNASHLGYQQLKTLAKGQFLPAYLKPQQEAIRQYLPVWAPSVMSAAMPARQQVLAADTDPVSVIDIATAVVVEEEPSKVVLLEKQSLEVRSATADLIRGFDNGLDDDLIGDLEGLESIGNLEVIDDSSAIHANPSDYRPEAATSRRFSIQGSQWLIAALLLIIALTALALLWFLVIQPRYSQPVAAVAIEPVIVTPVAPVINTLPPIELTIAVDDSGGLYSCNAKVGNVALRDTLQLALNTGFAEQASICELLVQQGVATDLTAMDIGLLPELLTLMRSVPFARLQLQNNIISLEAPDASLLQQLLVDIRTLLPNTTVTAVGAMALADNSDQVLLDGEMSTVSNPNNDPNRQFNNDFANNNANDAANGALADPNYQQADDDTNDRVVPAPNPNPNSNNSKNSFNNSPNNSFNNSPNNNNFNNHSQPSGPISLSEVDDLANSSIVAEPLRNARPVDKNINPNN